MSDGFCVSFLIILFDYDCVISECFILAEVGAESMPEIMAAKMQRHFRISSFSFCLLSLLGIVRLIDAIKYSVYSMQRQNRIVSGLESKSFEIEIAT